MVKVFISYLTINLLSLLAQCNLVDGFVLNPSKINSFVTTETYRPNIIKAITPTGPLPSSPSRLNLSETDLVDITASSEDARKLFFLWFFGGSGGGGIAVAAFPKMYDRFQTMRSLKDVGPTLGGTPLGLSPLCLYPRDLYLADVEKVLSNDTPVERMVADGPKDSFWADMGYLRFEAFAAANSDCDALAVRAVFDALTTSTSTVEPDSAQELLDRFKTDIPAFKRTLLGSKAAGYSAISVLLFLLGLTAYVSGEALATGWFPDWPGNANFPIGLVSPGVWTIPEYWI